MSNLSLLSNHKILLKMLSFDLTLIRHINVFGKLKVCENDNHAGFINGLQ